MRSRPIVAAGFVLGLAAAASLSASRHPATFAMWCMRRSARSRWVWICTGGGQLFRRHLLLHADQDTQMPFNQLYELQWAYEQAGRHAQTLILHGVDHVAEPFFKGGPVERVVAFLKRAIG
jgi:hypothetical protein